MSLLKQNDFTQSSSIFSYFKILAKDKPLIPKSSKQISRTNPIKRHTVSSVRASPMRQPAEKRQDPSLSKAKKKITQENIKITFKNLGEIIEKPKIFIKQFSQKDFSDHKRTPSVQIQANSLKEPLVLKIVSLNIRIMKLSRNINMKLKFLCKIQRSKSDL